MEIKILIALIYFLKSWLSVNAMRFVSHLRLPISEMLSDVHGECTSSTTESVSFGSKLACITLLAIESIVVRIHVNGIQSLVAQVALEAGFVPFVSSGQQLLGGIDCTIALKTDV